MNTMERVGVALIGATLAAGMTSGCSADQAPAEPAVTPYVFQSSDFEQKQPIDRVVPVETPGGPEEYFATRASKTIIAAVGCVAAKNGTIVTHTPNVFEKVVEIGGDEFTVTGKADSNAFQLTTGIASNTGRTMVEAVVNADPKEKSYGDGYRKVIIEDVLEGALANVETSLRVTGIGGSFKGRIEAIEGHGHETPTQWKVLNPETGKILKIPDFAAGDRIDDTARKLLELCRESK